MRIRKYNLLCSSGKIYNTFYFQIYLHIKVNCNPFINSSRCFLCNVLQFSLLVVLMHFIFCSYETRDRNKYIWKFLLTQNTKILLRFPLKITRNDAKILQKDNAIPLNFKMMILRTQKLFVNYIFRVVTFILFV